MKLTDEDKKHLEAAEGWLDLGNWTEADEELEKITASSRAHPEVLLLRWQVYAQAKKWDGALAIAQLFTKQVPKLEQGWLYLAESYHGMGQTEEAYRALVGISTDFRNRPAISYHIACYACALGDFESSKDWVEQAFRESDNDKALWRTALEDPALEGLWKWMKRR